MARKLSRRDLAKYAAAHLASGKAASTIARQLAAYLMESGRTKELNLVVRDIQFYLAEEGHIAGKVTSAHELTAATLKELESYAKQQTGAKHISLDTEIDESVIGGVKLEIPGHVLDTTVARHLTILKTRYKKA